MSILVFVVLKVIQVNIYKGKYMNSLLEFLAQEDPDFITMQEVTGGILNKFENSMDLFKFLRERIGMFGTFGSDVKVDGDPESFMGNAVFSKYKILNSETVTLKQKASLPRSYPWEKGHPDLPRHILDALIDLNGLKMNVLSWHGAWTAPPQDTFETLLQAQIAEEHIVCIKNPFIIGADLNAVIGSKTVELISKHSKNLMVDSGVSQTTHSEIHKIVPNGYLIDYIFVSSHFKKVSLEVPQITVSDHLPVVAQLELVE